MNARRIAEIHRELAELHQELAEAMAPDETEATPRKPIRKVKVHPGPVNPDRQPSEIDAARAARMLRRRGIAT